MITVVFGYTTVDNVLERPDGVRIGGFFIVAILAVSLGSPLHRVFEPRATEVVLDETAQIFVRDCARRTIRLVAHEPGPTARGVRREGAPDPARPRPAAGPGRDLRRGHGDRPV